MRLSEMETEQAVRLLCALTEPMCRIAEDEQTQDVVSELTDAGLSGLPPLKAWALAWSRLSPLLLHDHAAEVWEIAAALLGKTAAEVRRQRAGETLAQLRECWDEELLGFFSFAGCTGQTRC